MAPLFLIIIPHAHTWTTPTGKKMGVIFVSSDNSPSEFRDYFGSMPKSWGAIPSGDKRKALVRTLTPTLTPTQQV